MTEDEAKKWLVDNLNVSRETVARLELFIAILHEEMQRQNLISAASAKHIWARHIVDSAQLINLIPSAMSENVHTKWLDLGTGAGFPGVIIAILTRMSVVCVESRARRVEFLNSVLSTLGLNNCQILGKRLETVSGFKANIISARAFAPLPKLMTLSHRFSTGNTIWLLPKGKNAVRELEELPSDLRPAFHVEQSITDANAKILVGKGVDRPKNPLN